MEGNKNKKNSNIFLIDDLWEATWIYIKTVIDTVREPFLILDKNLRIVAANDKFYDFFKILRSETENLHIYNIANGQWNIEPIKKLLEEIVPKQIFHKDFEIDQEFKIIGRKIILLNARQIYGIGKKVYPQLILLAMEDITRERLKT